ncbi:hypothetical protein EK21DRAFT_110262 [Setomelanomma holmii]|uniref:Uncharacterized protein n=1 Tax=Setomelanomma holmii TaxID=210430 RepID=A0A9P4HE96_9PLEO|nr:hypothetical protein EK21DRAFT_110262 [Setomelanomma holmii]
MLCKTCQLPALVPVFGEHPNILKNIPDVIDELMPLLALHATASGGCTRCCIIRDAINKWQNNRGDVYHVEHPEQYVVGIAPMPGPGAKAARTGEVGLAVSVTRKEDWEHYGYLAWSRDDHLWEFDVKFELYTESEATAFRYHVPFLGSLASKPCTYDYARLTKEWLDLCLSHHGSCCPDLTQELPTRVIDVGVEGDDPRLVETRPGDQGIYCALSYCWGKSRAFTTISATFHDRLQGFRVEELPKTIRDAVLL